MDVPTTKGLAEAFYAEAIALFDAGKYARAASVLRVGAAFSDDDRIWHALGRCHEELGEDRLALLCYAAARTVCPSAVRCLLAAARLHELAGDVREACALRTEAENASISRNTRSGRADERAS